MPRSRLFYLPFICRPRSVLPSTQAVNLGGPQGPHATGSSSYEYVTDWECCARLLLRPADRPGQSLSAVHVRVT